MGHSKTKSKNSLRIPPPSASPSSKRSPTQIESGLEVAYSSEPEALPHHQQHHQHQPNQQKEYYNEKALPPFPPSTSEWPIVTSHLHIQPPKQGTALEKELCNPPNRSRWRSGPRKRSLIIWSVIILLVVIAVAVGAGLGAAKKKKHQNSSSNASYTSTSTYSVPSSATATSSPNAGEKALQPAAASTFGTQTGAGQLIYQNDDGALVQTVWTGDDDDDNTAHTSKKIPGVTAKNNTPIAVVGSNDSQGTWLFYLSPTNTLSSATYQNNVWTSSSSTGSISSLSITTHPESSLTAFQWNKTQIGVFYQKTNGTLQLLSFDQEYPDNGWFRPRPEQVLPAAMQGSSIAAVGYVPDAIRLYFQDETLQLREWCIGGYKPDWVECPSFINMKFLKSRSRTALSAVSWHNEATSTWVFYQPINSESTIDVVQWTNDTSWGQAGVQVVPSGSVDSAGRFVAAVDTATESSAVNTISLFYGANGGGVKKVNQSEVGSYWNIPAEVVLG